MALTFSGYLIEGARKLSSVDFGFSVKERKWDRANWVNTGIRRWGAKVLKLKPGVAPTRAVQEIFNHPDRWSFDCSQFCQVVSFYAQMKTLNAGSMGAFDLAIARSGNRLEIKPFHGAHFTVRKHYYRREVKTDWMKYRANPAMPYVPTRIRAWDLVRAAPVGTRVNFAIIGGTGAWRFENVIKVKMNPLQFTAQGLGARKIWDHDDLVIKLAQMKAPTVTTMAAATRIIWIKEVSIFANLPLPPHRRP